MSSSSNSKIVLSTFSKDACNIPSRSTLLLIHNVFGHNDLLATDELPIGALILSVEAVSYQLQTVTSSYHTLYPLKVWMSGNFNEESESLLNRCSSHLSQKPRCLISVGIYLANRGKMQKRSSSRVMTLIALRLSRIVYLGSTRNRL